MTTTSPYPPTPDAGSPSLLQIARTLEPAIRAAEEWMERERTIPAELAGLLYETGVFRTFLPRELGGLEVHPVEWLDMVEEISRVSGSVGWLAMINAGGTRLRPETMRRLLAEHGRWISASNLARVGGTARRVAGGYVFNGRWPFASGCPHSLFFSGLAAVLDEQGEPETDAATGAPRTIYTTMPAAALRILDTWDGLGLRGTGSHDVVAEDVFVAEEFAVADPALRPYSGPLYRGQFLFLAHAAHATGIARAAIDAFVELCNRAPATGSRRQSSLGKTQQHQMAVGRADALVRAARAFAWDAAGRAYTSAKRDGALTLADRVLLGQAIIFAVQTCKQAVDMVYEAAGASAVYRGTVLDRCFRDLHTAAQHIIVTDNRYDAAGQYILSRDQPGGPKVEAVMPF